MIKLKSLTSRIAYDLIVSIALLTRLPVHIAIDFSKQAGARSAWAWPLVGFLVTGIGLSIAAIGLHYGVSPMTAAIIAIAAQIFVTGALHEDGLADMFDGLWGGFDKKRRLEIMKDSQIGTYGVLSLIIITSLRVVALASLLSTENSYQAILCAAILSRLPMVILMRCLPNARGDGLANTVGHPSNAATAIASLITILIALAMTPSLAFSYLVLTMVISLAIAIVAKRKIGGQTGDILGASQQLCEAVLLTIAATHIS